MSYGREFGPDYSKYSTRASAREIRQAQEQTMHTRENYEQLLISMNVPLEDAKRVADNFVEKQPTKREALGAKLEATRGIPTIKRPYIG